MKQNEFGIGTIKRAYEIGKGEYRNKYIWSACIICGRERWEPLSHISKKCRYCRGIGANGRHANYKGGSRIRGYIVEYLRPGSFYLPTSGANGRIFQHRLVMAKHLGRNLHRWEIVHHKHTRYPAGSIEDKQDNRIENLQLVTDDRHKQITILENRISSLEKRIILLEAENILLRDGGRCEDVSV